MVNPCRQFKEFCALEGGATYLWPRWIVLRAIGIVFLLAFAGIIGESHALVGPRGIAPLGGFLSGVAKDHPNPLAAFCRAPSLFWIGSGIGMITFLEWCGLAAAAAVVLNLWPRLALFLCWLIFLSFVSTWQMFSAAIPDDVLLEAGLLAIPFAPAGLRPGFGAASPPRPIALFMMRWMVFRLMFESGLMKLLAGDPYWLHLSVMKVLYSTAPFPTILGYLDHQLPQAYHVFEIVLTFAAELAAPLLAVFCGRRGRWVAFGLWLVFQAGIQLTNNFGWLNTAAVAVGISLLDDQMLASAAARLRIHALAARIAGEAAHAIPRPQPGRVRLYGLRALLGLQFCLTVYFFVGAWRDAVDNIPFAMRNPVDHAWYFHSANAYYPFARITPQRYGVEFEGSDDGGKTWRPYLFRYQPQKAGKICPFIAPWYPRFEASLQVAVFSVPRSPLFSAVAAELIAGNQDVIRLFRQNPFPNRPPSMIRMPVYRLSFTDLATLRRTGDYWRKEYEGDYAPMVYLNDHGQLSGG